MGCSCPSCTYTDSFDRKGFDAWPKGNPAGPGRAKRDYTAHVAHAWKDARKAASVGPVGAAFYGGGKRAAEVLARTFAPGIPEPQWLEFDYDNWDRTKRAMPALLNPPPGLESRE